MVTDLEKSVIEEKELDSYETTPKASAPTTSFEHPILGEPAAIKETERLVIHVPRRLGDTQYKQLIDVSTQAESNRLFTEINLDHERMQATAEGIQQEAINIAVLRVAQMTVENRVFTFEKDQEGDAAAIYHKLADVRNSARKAWQNKPDLEAIAVADQFMQRFEAQIGKGAGSYMCEMLRTQTNGLIAKAISDELVSSWEMDPGAPKRDLPWQGDMEARNYVEALREYAQSPKEAGEKLDLEAKVEKQFFNMVAAYNARRSGSHVRDVDGSVTSLLATEEDKLGVIWNSAQRSSEEINEYESSAEAVFLFKRINGITDFSNIEETGQAVAKEMKERSKGRSLNLLDPKLAPLGRPTLYVTPGNDLLETHEMRVDELRSNDIGGIGIELLTDNIAAGFAQHELPPGKLYEKASTKKGLKEEWGANFITRIETEVKATTGMLKDFCHMAGAISSLEAGSGEETDIPNRAAIEVYELVVGRRAALALEANLDLNIAAPLFAIKEIPPSTKYEDEVGTKYLDGVYRENEARVQLATAIEYLDKVSARFYGKKGHTEEELAEYSYAFGNAIVANATLKRFGVDVLTPVRKPKKK